MFIPISDPTEYERLAAKAWSHILLFDTQSRPGFPAVVPCLIEPDATLSEIAAAVRSRMPKDCVRAVVGDRSNVGIGGRVVAIVLQGGTLALLDNTEPGDTMIWYFEEGVGIDVRRSQIKQTG